MIRYESVSKRYPDGTVAVHGLSLEIPSRQTTVLVGPSGCGKTTSLRMINRMTEPSSGRVLIDERDVCSVKPADLRRGIGYVIQQAGLFPNRTVVDNIATVPRLLGETKAVARRAAMGLLEQVGLSTDLADRYPGQLSGGQQQRVGVARALAADPPILLMDEPFSAVDPVVRDQLQVEFLHLQQDLGKTIVLVTHDIDEAIRLGDRVAVLAVGGVLAQVASPAELLAHPADSFVAGFVGRDRGYRALGFTPAGHLPLVAEQALTLGDSIELAREAADDGWALVVDRDQAPQGWLDVSTLTEHHASVGYVTPKLLNLGGTLATLGGTLREFLDATLSSPSRRGVVVDQDGRFVGTITAGEVLQQIEARRPNDHRRGRGEPLDGHMVSQVHADQTHRALLTGETAGQVAAGDTADQVNVAALGQEQT